ncbi:MAG: hypothetical protein GOV00_01345, partial [Candidatus Altiarchaeota archaeon]|nr:hypothetical protein [Candidatus Altiarchaeota archaeon]
MRAQKLMGQLAVLVLILVLASYRITSDDATETVDEGLKSNVSALGAWIGNLPVIGNSLV